MLIRECGEKNSKDKLKDKNGELSKWRNESEDKVNERRKGKREKFLFFKVGD